MGSSLDRLAAQAAGDTTAAGEPRPGFDASSALDSLAARAERLTRAQRALRRVLPPDFSDVQGGASSTADKPSLLSRLGGAARSLAPTPADQMLYGGMPLLGAEAGPLARFATGIGRQAASDVGTLARASAPSAGIGAPGLVESGQQLAARRAEAPAPGNVAMAGLRTALLAGGAGLADEAGTAALSRFLPGAVARPLARVATGAGAGAAFTPNDPAVGAIVGGVAGAAPSVADLLARRGVRTPEVAPAAAPTATASPVATPALNDVGERFSVVPLTTPARTAIGRGVRELASDRYAMLSAPEHQPLKEAILQAGAGRQHGRDVADLGIASARRGIAPDMVRKIEAQIYADNALSAANDAERRATEIERGAPSTPMEQAELFPGLATAPDAPKVVQALRQRAENFRRIQADAQGVAGADVRQSPEYASYLANYKQNVEPRFEDVAKAVGVTGAALRSVQPGSAYAPFAPETEGTGILPEPAQPVGVKGKRLGTKTSSAAETATGAAQQYRYDLAENVARIMGERARVAGGNRIVNEVAKLGQPVLNPKAPIPEGMARVKITDAFGLAPDAGTVRTFDVPENVKDALDVATQRLTPGPRNKLQRALGTLRRGATTLDLAVRPAVFVAHGLKNLGSLAGQIPGTSALDNLAASVVPGYAHLEGTARLAASDPLAPENVGPLLDLSQHGGLHPVENRPSVTHAMSRALFGPQGLDMRARLLMDKLLRQQAPDLTAAQRAQAITEQAGHYVPENQPAFQHFGQSTGLTSFAPAGAAFVRGSVRRLAGAPMYPGQSLGSRLATAGRIGGGGLATLEALNYGLSGHSTFANEPGHRLDVDRGKKDARGREEYIAGSLVAPLMERALRATGAEGAINAARPADVPLGVYRNIVNTALSQVGVGPRVGLGVANIAPYMTATGEAKVNVQPDFRAAETPFRITQGALGGVATGASALGGFDPYNANEPLAERLRDFAFGRVTSTGRGPRSVPPGYDDKTVGAIRRVESAPPGKRGAVIQEEVQGARDSRYPQWMVSKLAGALRSAARRAP